MPEDLGPVTAIQAAVAQRYHLSFADLVGPRRCRKFARPRQLAMYLAWSKTQKTYPQIGRAFRRDHTTIMHGVRVIRDRLAAGDTDLIEAAASLGATWGSSPQRQAANLDLESVVEHIADVVRRCLQRDPVLLIKVLKAAAEGKAI